MIDNSIIPNKASQKHTNVVDMPAGWMRELQRNENGIIKRNAHNVLTIFRNDPELKNKFVYDSFRNNELILDQLPWDRGSKQRKWTDEDDACLRNYFDLKYGIRSKELIFDCLQEEFKRNSYHPVKEYLSGLEWDGIMRLEMMLIKYLGAENSEYSRLITKKAFTAGVARILEPGCKYDSILTLTGAQGLGKSTVFRLMGKDWFLDSLQDTHSKDALQTIQGNWIIEIAELSAMRKSEIESFKNFITNTVDKYRPSYGRRLVERPRQCIFFGTTNEEVFLKDATGNRRFWPLKVTRKMTPKDIEEFNTLVDQFWAEAKHYYEQKETLYLTAEEEEKANTSRLLFLDEDSRKGMIEEYLDIKISINWKEKTINDRCEFIQKELNNETQYGTVVRNRISAIEVWCEYFAEPRGKFTPIKGRELRNMLKTMDGWEFIGQQRVGKEYGRQEVFERITD